MAEDDNFDIDIYGDGGEDYDEGEAFEDEAANDQQQHPNGSNAASVDYQAVPHDGAQTHDGNALRISQAQSQGTKRKDPDDRPLDPGATNALFLSDLPWWITDDEIRGWANESDCEEELEEVTFSEHKVNGKSKGQVYLLLSTPQAATAVKRLIDSFVDNPKYKQKFTANYTNPFNNPFKTLPKDGTTRNGSRPSPANLGPPPIPGSFSSSGYRGGRGGYSNRGGGLQSAGHYGRGGMQMGGAGGGGFQGNMGWQAAAAPVPGAWAGGFNTRGGGLMNNVRGNPMSMRGGRGGMGNMMGMPIGAMQMAMPGAAMMAMPQLNGMPGGGFQGANYFPQGDPGWNPHGAKRTRQE